MNIGIVTPYYPESNSRSSGIANHFYLLANTLNKSGHKVVVLHVRPLNETEDKQDEILDKDGITYILCKVSVPKFIKLISKNSWTVQDFYQKVKAMIITRIKLSKIARKYKIQIVETSSYFSLCYLYLFKVNTIPIVTRVSTTFRQMLNDHYPYKSRLNNLIASIEMLMIKKSNLLITHSRNHLLELEKILKCSLKKCQIIPHGVPLPALKDKTESSALVKILFVGRMESRKGIDILLKAIPIVLKTQKNIKFYLVGDNYEQYQKEYFAINNHMDDVLFLGMVSPSELDTLYSECDVFVAPSRYESFGLIYIEAMSYGKPVIGFSVGGVADIIVDYHNGLFSEKNENDLAEKILTLIRDKDLRESMGKQARNSVEEKYDIEIMVNTSLNYYQGILAR
ncbi:glycosyltransferase family 4 protein [Mucilaginibacter sp. McL0603]|uniref:glycosyltransferase family 4 protein n=1 Tax=Mucilaginibacter sp. McL0603 TaxID=3415670 RepID=UPI003CF4C71E